MEKVFQSKEFKRTRNAYIVYCALEYCVTLFASDSLMAKVLSHIGIGDSLIGIISSLLTLTCLFQLFSLFSTGRTGSVKKKSIIFCMMCLWTFTCLYIIPLLPFSKAILTILAFVCIITAYFSMYFVFPSLFFWANSFVDPEQRAEYSAVKEMFSLICGMAASFIAAYIIQYFEEMGNIRWGFIAVAALSFIVSLGGLASLLLMEDTKASKQTAKKKPPVGELIRYLKGNKSFGNIIIVTIVWNVAAYILLGYLGIYKIQELGIALSVVQTISIVASFARLVVSKPFGRLSDKIGFISGMKLALIMVAVSLIACMFTTPKTWWLIIVYSIVYSMAMAGIGQNLYNIVYSYVDAEYLEGASAIRSALGGVCGFGAALLGGWILNIVQSNGNIVLGISIYGQQLLAGISFMLVVVLIVYIHTVVEKQERRKQ